MDVDSRRCFHCTGQLVYLNISSWQATEEQEVLELDLSDFIKKSESCAIWKASRAESNSQSIWKGLKCYFAQLTVQDRNYSDLWQ